ncbi:MAG: hypothetical protein HQK76_01625 [Desulfobacterales bacterium]|nr:hypothetical protein [Desulfobacterales bacterium]
MFQLEKKSSRNNVTKFIKVLYERNGIPAIVFFTKPIDLQTIKDQGLLLMLETAVKVQAWVEVKIGYTNFKTILGFQFPPPGIESHYLEPIYERRQLYHGDISNDKAELENAIIQDGLWFSPKLCGGTIISCRNKIYVVPEKETSRLLSELKTRGATLVFNDFDSFEDLTQSFINENGLIQIYEQKDSRCFIATACFDTDNCKELYLLRAFRDKRLLSNRSGQLFVKTYYKVSPPIAMSIKKSPVLKKLIRTILINPLIFMIEKFKLL